MATEKEKMNVRKPGDYIPQEEQFNDWNELMDALRDRYTLPISEACKVMKASRAWINKYIRPHVPVIYLSSGHAGGKNWVRAAAKSLGESNDDFFESIWFEREKFEEFVISCIESVTKQTKRIPKTAFMTDEDAEAYTLEREKIILSMQSAQSGKEYNALRLELENLPFSFLGENSDILYLASASIPYTRRSSVPREPYELTKNPVYRWYCIADIKEYGDTDEHVYRQLFKKGAIRIEARFPDADGVIGKRIYYLDDEEQLSSKADKYREADAWIVPQKIWNDFCRKR